MYNAPRPSFELEELVEQLQNSAAQAETALGDAFNLHPLTWKRSSKIATAQAAYEIAYRELDEAREELKISLAYEAEIERLKAEAKDQGRLEAVEAALYFDPQLKMIARQGVREAAVELGQVERERKALELREQAAMEKAAAARTLLHK